jgi:metallophosphoesterase (TIGR00282 family)
MLVLFIGDIVGSPGRRAVRRFLPKLRERHPIDVVVANAENSAGGFGATPEILHELRTVGVDVVTMGNHTWRQSTIISAMESNSWVIRPANYAHNVPGRGFTLHQRENGVSLGVVNVLGRVFMDPVDCPFAAVERALDELRKDTSCLLVDMHAEATAEKMAMGWFLDGRASAVVGTHTHVMTADERILPQGTAYITDVGMCGPINSVIGTEVGAVLYRFTTGMPKQFRIAHGPAVFSAVLITIDEHTGKATHIERISLCEEEHTPPKG